MNYKGFEVEYRDKCKKADKDIDDKIYINHELREMKKISDKALPMSRHGPLIKPGTQKFDSRVQVQSYRDDGLPMTRI